MRRFLLLALLCSPACRRQEVEQTVERAPTVSPQQLVFEETWRSTERTASVQVTNPNTVSRRLVIAPLESPFDGPASVELPPGETVEVRVRFQPARAGRFMTTLQLVDPVFEPLDVPVSGVALEWPACPTPAICGLTRFEPREGRCVTSAAPDATDCSDAPACLEARCQAGRCVALANRCDDSNPCTLDACAPEGCVHAPFQCPASTDPCRTSACSPDAGCLLVPVADGASCGEANCVRARVCISGACVLRQVPATPSCTQWELEAFVKASNTGTGDAFGAAVALSASGDTLAVGAPLEDSLAASMPLDNGLLESGAVFIYRRAGVFWSLEAFLKASSPGSQDRFGASVALSSDGSTLVVGAPGEDSAATGVDGNEASNAARDSGAAFVFRRTGTTWAKVAYLKASNTRAGDAFGSAVAISSAGDTIVVGAPDEDSAALDVNADQTSSAAAGAGAVYLFDASTTGWSQVAYLKATNTGAGDGFGTSVALASDGLALAVGAPGEDSSGPPLDDARLEAGAAYLFRRTARLMAPGASARVKPSQPVGAARFGQAVALDGVGLLVVVGAPGEAGTGAVHPFRFTTSSWLPGDVLRGSARPQDGFGQALTLAADGATLAVGAPGDDATAMDSGAAFLFRRSADTFTLVRSLKAGNPDAQDAFGGSLSLSGDGATLAIGAMGESSGATGVDGDESNNTAPVSGATYVY